MTDTLSDAAKTARVSLVWFVVLCLAVAAAGGAVTATSVTSWYAGLQKPPFNPPNAVFGPVWTVLYLMMAVAGHRLWQARGHAARGRALSLWFVQLAVNCAWSFLFFGAHRPGLALIDIGALLGLIVASIVVFARIDRLAAWLFAPYLAWVSFATVLNAAIWYLNP